MVESQRTTTDQPKQLFEPPDLQINEAVLADRLGLDIVPENLTPLVTANFLLAMDARDRRLSRQFFEEVLVMAFNFQNRLVRIAEIASIVRTMSEGKDLGAELQSDLARHLASAKSHQTNLLKTVKIFSEMRGVEDSVS